MKKYVLIAVALMLASGSSHAQNRMVELGEYLAKNSDMNKPSMLYMISRCSAYFALTATLAPNKKTEELSLDKAQYLMNVATLTLKDIKGGKLEDLNANSLKTITAMTRAYIAEANKNYTLRGNYIKGSKLLEGDADICAKISESF